MKNLLGIHFVRSEELPDDLQYTKERHPDVLKKVTDEAGESYVLHIEFQSKNDPGMVYRMAEYFVMLYRLYQMEVRQYVIYIGPGSPTMTAHLNCRQMQFHYQLILLSQIDYQLLLSADDPRLKMLAILADFKGDAPTAIIEQIIIHIFDLSESPLDTSKHINQLRILSQLRNLDQEISEVMESIATFFSIERDPYYIRGEKKGLEKGKKTIVKNLLRTTDFSTTRIASLAEVTEDFVLEVKRSLN
jgi:hypothetical protein